MCSWLENMPVPSTNFRAGFLKDALPIRLYSASIPFTDNESRSTLPQPWFTHDTFRSGEIGLRVVTLKQFSIANHRIGGSLVHRGKTSRDVHGRRHVRFRRWKLFTRETITLWIQSVSEATLKPWKTWRFLTRCQISTKFHIRQTGGHEILVARLIGSLIGIFLLWNLLLFFKGIVSARDKFTLNVDFLKFTISSNHMHVVYDLRRTRRSKADQLRTLQTVFIHALAFYRQTPEILHGSPVKPLKWHCKWMEWNHRV